jgi:hypothetical protein
METTEVYQRRRLTMTMQFLTSASKWHGLKMERKISWYDFNFS